MRVMRGERESTLADSAIDLILFNSSRFRDVMHILVRTTVLDLNPTLYQMGRGSL